MADSYLALARKLVEIINAREAESARVARVLHDDVGQVLSAVGLQLDVLRMDLRDKAPEIGERTAEIQDLLGQVVERLRNLSYELNPSIVERAGFQFALDRLIGRYRNEFRGSIRFLYDSAVRLPAETASVLYKIAEHALDNSVRHSGGNQVEVLVRPTLRATALEVRDNGRGFEPPGAGEAPRGMGLLLMEHYARQAGLEFSVKSGAGQGTIVKASQRFARTTTERGGSESSPGGRSAAQQQGK